MPEYEQSYESNLRPKVETVNKPVKKQKSPDILGACWMRENDRGVEYLSIKLELNGETLNIKGFLNSEKNPNDNRPQYILYKSKNIKKELN